MSFTWHGRCGRRLFVSTLLRHACWAPTERNESGQHEPRPSNVNDNGEGNQKAAASRQYGGDRSVAAPRNVGNLQAAATLRYHAKAATHARSPSARGSPYTPCREPSRTMKEKYKEEKCKRSLRTGLAESAHYD